MESKRTNLQDRYEFRETLGRGGMGIVYKAYDRLMNREVALKTILDIDNPDTLALFYKEWSTLVTMVHPNVISIYDIGEFEQDGVKKPFFVMPLLPGVTLDRLIKEGSPRLSVAGVMAIIDQAARGLHAAHEQGLVHRDVKPSNIFVMDDGSVKIIDFGIVRSATAHSKTTLKGTLYYMAPEQLEMKPPSPAGDMFALGVVTYEALTRQRPFRGSNDGEVIEAIQRRSAPPVSELNHEVSYAISQVIHKAMAKQPWHRFFNIREYGDALMKALRNEPLEYFDSTKIKPRLDRATQSFEQRDYEFASEILSELEAEGHLDQGIALLRGQVDQVVRQLRIKQLLENARRFYEAGEYPLALRKIQEALDLDSSDATALSLKAQVERERRERKISEWITLARQHMENQSFRQAREALDNVLQLKPNDTDALNLAAEIGRREQEVAQIRDRKSKLYQGAMQAWEKGEVTAALSKLEVLISMDRDQPEADTGRSGSYQGFYNRVQSEHNALKNSLEEAHRLLAADNFENALVICRQYLSKYPNHVLFQSLQFDIEERQRQSLSRVIAETDRRADEEPDLDRRLGILTEVLKVYPGEPHFERAIQTVRDKRDLVNSIVTKARFFEERGQFVEALDQWQILRSIHEKQPGLAFEIERLIMRRDQQALLSSRARWVEQTDKYLEGGDYERAMKTIQSALMEFSGDPELMELEKLVRKQQERAAQAVELLNRARDHVEKGTTELMLAELREAIELDPRNSVIRTVLVNTLLTHARKLIDSSPEAAEATLKEILQIDPSHVAARNLSAQLAERKREEFVTWCLAQSRRLQTDGDISGALAVAAQGLASYPHEPRLQQLQATLQRAHEATQRTPVPGSIQPPPLQPPSLPPQPSGKPVPPVSGAVPMPPVPPAPPPLQSQMKMPPPPPLAGIAASGIGAPPVDEPTRVAYSFPTIPTVQLKKTSPAPPSLQEPAAQKPAAQKPVEQKPVEQKPAKQKLAEQKPVEQKKAFFQSIGGAIIGGVVVLLLLIGFALFLRRKPTPPSPVTGAVAKVNLRTTPPGAEILVNGTPCGSSTCELSLKPGDYRAEARLADYQPAAANFTISANQSAVPDVNLTLLAIPPMLIVATDLSDGALQMDGAPAGPIVSNELDIAKLAPGQHTLYLKNGTYSSKLTLEIADGAMPKVVGPVQTQGMQDFIVAHSGATARVYGSIDGAKATLDGKPAGALNADGLELDNLASGTHELVVDTPQGASHLLFDSGPSTGVYASLLAFQNVAPLNIVTGENDVKIFVNGKLQDRTTRNGRALFYLPPTSYTVRVQKDGFATLPDQTVTLTKGQEGRLEFHFASARATLAVHHGVLGTEVLVDDKRLGIVSADGEFSAAYIEPGRHIVTLRHERYKDSQFEQTFVAGKPVDLDGTLQNLYGTLKIEITPSDAHLRIRRQGDSQDQEVHDASVSLVEGLYTVFASARGYQDAQITQRVPAGGTATASLALRNIESTPSKVTSPPTPAEGTPRTIFTIEDWLKLGWIRDSVAVTKQGGNFVLVPVDLTKATIEFSALVLKGKRLEWVVSYRDDRNYDLFQMDETNFTRTPVVNGNKGKTMKIAHGAKHGDYTTFGIEITPEFIAHVIRRDQQWVQLDTLKPPDGVAPGKFGFHIPGKDQIALSDFKITQK